MNAPYTCPHCASDNTEHLGPQQSVEVSTLKYYEYPYCQCHNCGTSFGVIADKVYTGRLFELPAKVSAS